VQDKARHLATLYLNDLADVLREAADPRFEFVRYAESLAMAQPTFDPLAAPWPRRPRWWTRPCSASPGHPRPPPAPGGAAVGALPGSVYAAFRIAQTIKAPTRPSSPCWAAAS
jgi:hypothetical protein